MSKTVVRKCSSWSKVIFLNNYYETFCFSLLIFNYRCFNTLFKEKYLQVLKQRNSLKIYYTNTHGITLLFSSPEPKAQGEVLWSLTVRRRRRRRRHRPYVRPSTIFKQHLLLNHWLEFDQTSQEWSLVGPLSKLFKWFRSVAYLGHRS